MNKKDQLYLWTRSLILPVATLVPFFFTKRHELSCDEVSFAQFSSVEKYTVEPNGPCTAIAGPKLAIIVSIALGLLAVLIISLLKVEPKGREAMRRFIAKQFVLSASIAAITCILYIIFRNLSQGENFEVINFSPDGTIASQHSAIFGLGISVQTFLLLVAVYMLIPFLRWYKLIFSRNYVAGQKKEELFQ